MRYLLTLVLLLCAIPVFGQGTYYIDYGSGSDSNSGTSQGSPWKTHPYMACSGGSHGGWAHHAGDTYIFKIAVTWPASCFPMTVTAGGSSSSSRDVYTVNPSWTTGSGSMYIFAGQGVTMEWMLAIRASNITFQNLDIGGQNIGSVGSAACDGATVYVSSGQSNVMVQYSKLHDWVTLSNPGAYNNHTSGGMCAQRNPNNGDSGIYLDHSEVRDDGNVIGGQIEGYGACGSNIGISFSICHYLMEGIVNHDAVHDTEFTQLGFNYDPLNYLGTAHSNVIEDDTGLGDGPIYNNYIHDTFAGVTINADQGTPIFNNVLSNNYNVPIRGGRFDSGPGGPVTNIFNNTVDTTSTPQDAFGCFAVSTTGVVNMANNICVPHSGQTAFIFIASPSGGNYSNPGYSMSPSTASNEGFTSASKYYPNSIGLADPSVKGAGTNFVRLMP